MNKYCLVENFANSCSTPCLVGDLSPYDFTNALYLAGKNYRIAHSVAPITMEDIDTPTESFTNNQSSMDTAEMLEEAKKTISAFIPEECFLNTYLNTNFKLKLENDYSNKKYQIDIKILKVPNSENYRFVCNPHGIDPSQKYENGYFLKVNDKNNLIISEEPLYTINTNNTNNTNNNESILKAERAADLFNEYNGTAMEIEQFTMYNSNKQNNMSQLIMNSNNTLLFRFWKTYDQKILINVFDNGIAAEGSNTGKSPQNYGYMIYKSDNDKDDTISFISRTELFPSKLSNQNDAGAYVRLINLNYDLLIPYKIPNVSLNNKLTTNIKFPDSDKNDGSTKKGKIMIEEYYINNSALFYVYRCKIKINGKGGKYVFSIDDNNKNITIVKKCDETENMLFTFWQTLDKQFIIAKYLKNTLPGGNCEFTQNNNDNGSAEINYIINLENQNYKLIGLDNDTSELITVNRFVNTLHFNIDTVQIQVDPVDSLIKYIQNLALAQLNNIIQSEVSKETSSITVQSIDESDNCNDKTVNFILFLKIISICIALFLFLDLDYSDNLAIKIFKGFFAMLFSEVYLVFQFIRIVIYGS